MQPLQSIVQRLTSSVGVAACAALAALVGIIAASVDGRPDIVAALAVICGYCLAMVTVRMVGRADSGAELWGHAARTPREAKVEVRA